jgi:uncharacterized protein (TIGR00251 family)
MKVHAIPRASRTETAGFHDGALKVRVQAPPSDGEANEVLRAFLAKALKVSKSSVRIDRGTSSRHKMVYVEGVTRERVLGTFTGSGG